MGYIWATYGQPICGPYAAHMWPICRVFSKTTKLYVAHMLSNIMVTYGKKQINIWAELQHMGNTYGLMWSFSHWKWALLNIWAAYGKHMGSIPYMVNTNSNTSKPLPSPADAAPLNSVKLPPSLFESIFINKKIADWIMEMTKSWLVSVLLPLSSPSPWRWKREVAVSFSKSCAISKRRRCMNGLQINYIVKTTNCMLWSTTGQTDT